MGRPALTRVCVFGLALLLAACGNDGETGSDVQRDSQLEKPSADVIADAATSSHDGAAVLGCDYVLLLDTEILLSQSEGTTYPFNDLETTLDLLRMSDDPTLLALVDVADQTETAPETTDAINAIQSWCEDEALL